jgi:hypothetical protein
MNILAELEESSQSKDQLYFANEAYGYALMLRSKCIAAIDYIDLILMDLTVLERMLAKPTAH